MKVLKKVSWNSRHFFKTFLEAFHFGKCQTNCRTHRTVLRPLWEEHYCSILTQGGESNIRTSLSDWQWVSTVNMTTCFFCPSEEVKLCKICKTVATCKLHHSIHVNKVVWSIFAISSIHFTCSTNDDDDVTYLHDVIEACYWVFSSAANFTHLNLF